MRLRRGPAALAAVGLAAAVAVASGYGAGSRSSIVISPRFASSLTSYPSIDWPTTGGNLWNNRYSTLTQINTTTVKRLKLRWVRTFDGVNAVEQEGGPLEYQGTMYVATGKGSVYAVDPANGRVIWRYTPHIRLTNPFGISAQRGLALGEGKVFLAQNNGTIVALNQWNGEPVWKATIALPTDHFLGPAAPVYYDGMVFVGMSGGDAGARGHFDAFDASTGEHLWRFYTIPEPGAPGSGTWVTPGEWEYGGGATWTMAAIDPSLGLVYFTTGNAGPYSGRGPGANLFTSSVVAVDLKTGQYVWHYQAVHHDMWDYDCPAPVLLFDASYKGVLRHGLVITCKTGWAYFLDRKTGNPLLEIPEKAVPHYAPGNTFQNAFPHQPEPVGDAFAPQCASKKAFPGLAPDGKRYRISCIFTAYGTDRYVAFSPGLTGGGDWPPMSYDPELQRLYVCAQASTAAMKAIPSADIAKQPGQYRPGAPGFTAAQQGAPKHYKGELLGTFTAINVHTNRIVWQKRWTKASCYSGSMTTAGGLVFVGDTAGVFHVYSAKTGAELWHRKLRYSIGAPPVTYEVNGRQYVAIYDGGAAALLGGPKKKRDLMYVFSLG